MGMFLAVLPLVVIATATLSGIFGMAGGMILMGVYAACLPVHTAMVLHGTTQLASNGSRAWLFREHIYWRGVAFYLLGVLPSLAIFAVFAIVVDRATLFLAMGAIPIVVALLPRSEHLRIESPPIAAVCGFIVTAAHLTAGVSGPLLDIFFVKGSLTRHEVIGTKAVTQSFAHVLKLVYFGTWVGSLETIDLPLWVFPVAVVCAFVGTATGKRILHTMSDVGFRRWSTAIVLVLATIALLNGAREALGA